MANEIKWRIHHVNLQTHNIPESVDFYTKVLGLATNNSTTIGTGSEEMRQYVKGKVAVVGEGDGGFHLNAPMFDLAKRNGLAINPGMGGHVAIAVDNLDEIKGRLDAQGVFYADPGDWAMKGVKQIYLYDPSGNIIEINEAGV